MADQRKRCPWCGKLAPLVSRREVYDVDPGTPPEPAPKGWRIYRVVRWEVKRPTGEYVDRLVIHMTNDEPGQFQYGAFDRLSCARRFANAAYEAGFRRKDSRHG